MLLPKRLILLFSLVALAGCTTHDRMAYQTNYWRGRNVQGAKSSKPAVDAEVMRQLNEAAAQPTDTGAVPAPGPGAVTAPGTAPVTPANDPFAAPSF